jgi:tetratricopeptide (TPR) repeat protein
MHIFKVLMVCAISIAIVLSISPFSFAQSAEMYYSLGQKYTEEGNFDLASLSLKKAVELSPDWAEAHNALGMAYFQLFKFNDAIAQFNKAIELKPYYTEAKINLNRTKNAVERYTPIKTVKITLWSKIAIVSSAIAVIVITSILIAKRI